MQTCRDAGMQTCRMQGCRDAGVQGRRTSENAFLMKSGASTPKRPAITQREPHVPTKRPAITQKEPNVPT